MQHLIGRRRRKSKVWIPQDTTINLAINSFIPVQLNGLTVLGTAAQADHSTLIALPCSPIPGNRLIADATARLLQAEEDAALLEQMAETVMDDPLRYVA